MTKSALEFGKEDVLRGLPSLLRQVAFNPSYTEEACQLLWELGRTDVRPLNQYPDHAIRILSELAGYSHGKPLRYSEMTLSACEKWFDDPSLPKYAYSPLDVIDALLEKQVEFTSFQGHSFQIGTARLNRDVVEPLRKRALACVEKCSTYPHPRIAARVLASLRKVIEQPIAMYGATITDQEREQWVPERIKGAALLASFVQGCRSPALLAEASSRFKWFAENAKPKEVAEAVGNALAAIPDTLDVKMARALTRALFDIGRGDAHDFGRMQQEFLSDLARDFTDKYKGEDAIYKLEEAVIDVDLAGVESGHGQWFYVISKESPDLGFSAAEHIFAHENCALARYSASVIHALWLTDEPRFRDFAQRVSVLGTADLKSGLGYAYSYSEWFKNPQLEDFRILRNLLNSGEERAKYHAMQAIKRLGGPLREQQADNKIKRRAATFAKKGIALLLEARIDEDARLAEGLCEALDPKFGISPELLSKTRAKKLLQKLVPIGDVTHQAYHFSQVLGFFAERMPEFLFDFFLKRIRFASKQKKGGMSYSAIPFGLEGLFSSIDGTQLHEVLLRKVSHYLAASRDAVRSYWYTDLFRLIAGSFGDATIRVISELEQKRTDASYRTIAILLSNAPPGFVFGQKDFCAQLLERARELSQKSYDRIASTLAGSAETGTFTVAPGQPSPKHVSIRDNANALAEEFKARPEVASFFKNLAQHAQVMINDMLRRDEEEFVE